MKKQLTESQLVNILSESVIKVLEHRFQQGDEIVATKRLSELTFEDALRLCDREEQGMIYMPGIKCDAYQHMIKSEEKFNELKETLLDKFGDFDVQFIHSGFLDSIEIEYDCDAWRANRDKYDDDVRGTRAPLYYQSNN